MVYTPRRYFIPAAVALVAVQLQEASATSLYYDPFTSANTTDEISSKFPARGANVADQDCAITVEIDPTLPDITTITTVSVNYTELLANTTTAPTETVSTFVGKSVYSISTPSTAADQDAYTTTTTTSTSTSTTSTTQSSTTSSSAGTTKHSKTGTTVSQTSTSMSTTTSTKTGVTSAPASSSSVAGSSAEETTSTTSPSTKTGTTITTGPSTSTSVAGSSVEDTTSTATPGKTGVTTTTASSASSSVAGSSAEEITSTALPSTKTGVTVTAAPSTSTSVAGSSAEETTSTASPGKTGVTTTTSAPTTSSNVGGASEEEPNCATGWEDQSSRKLRHALISGRKLQEKVEKKRQLEANTNKDIAKLEAYFGSTMETTLANLPTVGVHTPSPWPGPYWPTYQDSINVIWSAGEPSAAEKYATAFGLDVTDFMDKVSADNGIDSMSSHTVCSSDSDCSSLTDGSSCSIRADKTSGYCIPTWYGICHAWTPAAMLEDEPQCAVTYNGVTFQPLDIKALLSDVYDGATVTTVFTGTRYNGGTDSTDEYGRHSSDAYRDLNPAYFHITAANLLGSLNATFIADVTAGSEVWNQPVRGFKVYEQTEMTLEEAASTFYGLETYPWNAAAKSIVYVKTRLSWIFETYTDGGLVSSGQVDSYTTGAYYYYILELDDAGEIIGGEWVYDSDDDHPDFLWFPKAKPAADTVTSIGLSYADVTMLLEKSVACEGSSSGSEAVGSSASASASASTSASTWNSAPNSASTSGSNAFSSLPGSASTGSATSNTGSAATVAPVSESTEAPVATEAATETSTTAPAATTATSSGNTGSNPYWSGHWVNDDSDDSQQQQGQNNWWFHWW
ncbi:hypothetical protein V7S43_014252 [Phytophthora oleae]|uniref:Transglutaminase elicitor n=1 Tax=Phytophthora oleae TaxID=2107226 RepID=A0ABD3F5W7_9STRA